MIARLPGFTFDDGADVRGYEGPRLGGALKGGDAGDWSSDTGGDRVLKLRLRKTFR